MAIAVFNFERRIENSPQRLCVLRDGVRGGNKCHISDVWWCYSDVNGAGCVASVRNVCKGEGEGERNVEIGHMCLGAVITAFRTLMCTHTRHFTYGVVGTRPIFLSLLLNLPFPGVVTMMEGGGQGE